MGSDFQGRESTGLSAKKRRHNPLNENSRTCLPTGGSGPPQQLARVFVVFSPLSLPLVWRGFLNASEERGGGQPKLLAMSRRMGSTPAVTSSRRRGLAPPGRMRACTIHEHDAASKRAPASQAPKLEMRAAF